MTCYALLTVSSRTGPLSWGRGLGVRPPVAASSTGCSEGGGLGGCRAIWGRSRAPSNHHSYQFRSCPMLAAREEAASPPSLLSLEGSWFRLPRHLAWHEWSFSPTRDSVQFPHHPAALTNTVSHTVFLPSLPSPVPCLPPACPAWPLTGVGSLPC